MGVVETCAEVTKEREGPDGIVAGAASIELQRCSANRSIVIPGIEEQRPSATPGVVAGRRLEKERQPTNPGIECVSGLQIKGSKPFCGVARCKHFLRKHLRQKHEAAKHGQDCSEYNVSIFH